MVFVFIIHGFSFFYLHLILLCVCACVYRVFHNQTAKLAERLGGRETTWKQIAMQGAQYQLSVINPRRNIPICFQQQNSEAHFKPLYDVAGNRCRNFCRLIKRMSESDVWLVDLVFTKMANTHIFFYTITCETTQFTPVHSNSSSKAKTVFCLNIV